MRMLISLLALLLPAVGSSIASAQPAAPKAEVALTYNWVHTNAPPDACGCFSMNGGSAAFAYRFMPSWSVVAEAGAVTNGNVNSTGLGLTLAEFLAGARYTYRNRSRLQPFGQVLLGDAHTSGSLSPDRIGLNSADSFALAAGGGVDLNLTPHVALRAVQADYYLTLLPNRATDTQNNLRLSTGLILRFGRK